MSTLTYKARSNEGQVVSGSIEASSPRDAMRRLRQKGVQIISIDRATGIRATLSSRWKWIKRERIKSKEVLSTLAQLELMIGSGTGLDDALRVLGETTRNTRFRQVLSDVRDRVKGGESFSEALGAHPDVFTPITTRMVAAGETSGTLSTMLGSIHEMLERQADIRKKIMTAMAYPAVLLTVASGAMCVLFIWVLPKFAQVFAEVGAELPAITRVVLAISEFVKSHVFLLAAAAVLIAVTIRGVLRISGVKRRLHRGMLAVPVIGQLIRCSNTARATQIMGTLWRSGLPIMEVTRLTGATIHNPLYREFFEQLRQSLIDGKRMTTVFAATDLFPPTVAPLIRTGEETGNTPKVLAALASHHEKETDGLIKTMITLLEPAIIIMMAGAVGLIAISVVIPLFRLSSAVH